MATGSAILVDRLWPRGLTKEKAQVDLWLKEIAPSDNDSVFVSSSLTCGAEHLQNKKGRLEVSFFFDVSSVTRPLSGCGSGGGEHFFEGGV